MKIPKLANGGIIKVNNDMNKDYIPFRVHARNEFIVPIDNKGYKIYKRTKKRRIKKKQLKRYPTLEFRLALETSIKKAIANNEIKVMINGVEYENN